MEDKYLELILQVVGIVSVLANLTPNESDNKIVKYLNVILNIFAANVNVKGIGNNGSKDEKK